MSLRLRLVLGLLASAVVGAACMAAAAPIHDAVLASPPLSQQSVAMLLLGLAFAGLLRLSRHPQN